MSGPLGLTHRLSVLWLAGTPRACSSDSGLCCLVGSCFVGLTLGDWARRLWGTEGPPCQWPSWDLFSPPNPTVLSPHSLPWKKRTLVKNKELDGGIDPISSMAGFAINWVSELLFYDRHHVKHIHKIWSNPASLEGRCYSYGHFTGEEIDLHANRNDPGYSILSPWLYMWWPWGISGLVWPKGLQWTNEVSAWPQPSWLCSPFFPLGSLGLLAFCLSYST